MITNNYAEDGSLLIIMTNPAGQPLTMINVTCWPLTTHVTGPCDVGCSTAFKLTINGLLLLLLLLSGPAADPRRSTTWDLPRLTRWAGSCTDLHAA